MTNDIPARPGRAATPREVWEHAMSLVKGSSGYDHAGFAEMFTADGVMELPFAPAGVPKRLEGHDQIRAVLTAGGQAADAAGFENKGLRHVEVYETTDPELIVVEYDVEGAIASTGRTYVLSYIQVVRVHDGEIVLLRDYWDPTAQGIDLALRAMESTPTP